MKRKSMLVGALVLGLLLTVAVGMTQAQRPEPPEGSTNRVSDTGEVAAVSSYIPIQGRLTDAGGNPLDGSYSITFRLYDVSTGGTALCINTRTVSVNNGLFNTYMQGTNCKIDGRQLYLGVQVESDPEMSPRQYIDNVPYAWSLRPGAVISDSVSYDMLTVRNRGSGVGLHGIGTPGVLGESGGLGHGIVGRAGLFGAGVKGEGHALGFGGLFTSTGGIALRVESDVAGLQVASDGVAIEASGSGRIRSTAPITIAVSPLKMVPFWDSIGDVEFLSEGPYMEIRPVSSGLQYVHIPVDLPSVLFGTSTKLRHIRICYKVDQAGSFIDTTTVSQGTDSGTLDYLIDDTTNRNSTSWVCYTVTDTTPDTLTGSVYIRLTLNFAGTGSAHDIRIGNIALTLVE